jgi:hypothetical protein
MNITELECFNQVVTDSFKDKDEENNFIELCKQYGKQEKPFIFESSEEDNDLNVKNIYLFWDQNQKLRLCLKTRGFQGCVLIGQLRLFNGNLYEYIGSINFVYANFKTYSIIDESYHQNSIKNSEIYDILEELKIELGLSNDALENLEEFIEREEIDEESFYLLDRNVLKDETNLKIGNILKIIKFIEKHKNHL